MSGSPPTALAKRFVGRDDELLALQQAWHDGGTAVVVRGQAGIGKSRLIRELGALATGRGGLVLVGRTTAAARATPLRPVREALLGAARRGIRPGVELGPYGPALASLVPDWRDDSSTSAPIESLELLGEALLRFLIGRAGHHPAALVIEDLQWADPETRSVLEFVAENLGGSRVLLLLSVRDGEPGPGSDLAASLVERRSATELRLDPLDPAAVAELARSCISGGGLPSELVAALAARSEGVPFLVEELVASALRSGWDTVSSAVPASVVRSIELRLEELPGDTRRVITAAALLGREFDWALAADAAGIEESRAVRLLSGAVRAQILDVDGAGFRFHHALTRDAIVTSASPPDLAVLARAALTRIDDVDADLDRCVLAADLADRVGDHERAAALLLGAARWALEGGALSSAEELAVRARAQASREQLPTIDELLLEINVLAGDTARAIGLGADLLGHYDDPARLADVHLLIGAAERTAGRNGQALDHAEAAARLAPDDGRRARASGLAAQAAMDGDDLGTAAVRAGEALTFAEASGSLTTQCEALEVVGRIERGRDLAAAERAFQQAYDIADAAALPIWRVRALQELGTIDLFDTLRLDRLDAARSEAAALGALATMATVDLQLAAAYNERGETLEAIDAARRCSDVSERLGLSTFAMGHAVRAMAHARRGEQAEMEEALGTASESGQDPDYVESSVWGNGVPMLCIVRGDLVAAAAGLDRGMEVLRRRPAAALPFPGLWALVRTLIDDGGQAARAEVAALPVDSPVSRRTLGAADAVALGHSGDRVQAEARFRAIDAELDFEGGRFRRSFLRLLVAPAAFVDGWGTPEMWLREALAGFEELGLDALAGRSRQELRALGAAVPRRSSVSAAALPPALAGMGVTAREVDVLLLAAAGATNREIAERLFISHRTVEKHVERLVQKTGVTRASFGDLACDTGLRT